MTTKPITDTWNANGTLEHSLSQYLSLNDQLGQQLPLHPCQVFGQLDWEERLSRVCQDNAADAHNTPPNFLQ